MRNAIKYLLLTVPFFVACQSNPQPTPVIQYYTFVFNGTNCTLDNKGYYEKDEENPISLKMDASPGFILPDTIEVAIGNKKPATPGVDYTYTLNDEKTSADLSLCVVGNVSVTAKSHLLKLTLDGNGGKWVHQTYSENKYEIDVKKGSKFYEMIKDVIEPQLTDQVFKYYVSTPKGTTKIEDFTINGDTTVYAYYKPASYVYDAEIKSDMFTFDGGSTAKHNTDYVCNFTSKTATIGGSSKTLYKELKPTDIVVTNGNQHLSSPTQYTLSNNKLTIVGKYIDDDIKIVVKQAELSDDISWSDIISIASTDEGGGAKASTIFHPGAYKKASDNNYYRMVDFDYDTISVLGTTPAAITFDTMNTTSITYLWDNEEKTKFQETSIYSTLNDSTTGLITSMPAEFKDSIKFVDKINAQESIRFNAKLFLPSLPELNSVPTYFPEGSLKGDPYDFYVNKFEGINEQRTVKNEKYLTRDTNPNSYTNGVCTILKAGSVGNDSVPANDYISIFFCI